MNPHIEKAQTLLTASKTAYATEHRAANAAQANVEASLAIAFELQTANILALSTRLQTPVRASDEDSLYEVAERLDIQLDPIG